MHRKGLLIPVFIFLYSYSSFCQIPRKSFASDSLPEIYFTGLRKEYGKNKEYPQQFEKQILIALSYYPELKNTPILFRIKKKHSILATRTAWSGFFASPQKRSYVITISESTEGALMPILFKNLSFNAQVGVIGHELGHVIQFSVMTGLQIVRHGIRSISAKYIDHFEYETDGICIAHGLGYQLLEWSSFVRRKMSRENWGGPDKVHRLTKRERYMNPATILKRINEDLLYETTR